MVVNVHKICTNRSLYIISAIVAMFPVAFDTAAKYIGAGHGYDPRAKHPLDFQ